ncbi:MAG: formimidoylglutamate deiminase [Ktedonobacteraceae bacterium]|nr:formimidoylglutamate deiminase [Ktedonobacteraceae bacterium]
MHYLAPDYIYTPHGIQSAPLLSISDDGYITAITERSSQSVPPADSLLSLPDTLLLPGFVNAHSHIFQRALRGHTHRPLSSQDTFWSWRSAMYAAAQRLTPDALYEMALPAYREMLAAGYTTVGEFHYVHHQPNGQPYAHSNAMAEAVLNAGHDASIRVVLLMSAYAQGGINQPLEEGQRRFGDASVEAYLARVDALRISGAPVGLAPHSVRAVPESWFRPIAAYSRAHSLPLHVHADEQRAEIEQCQAAYGCTPIELLERYEALSPLTTVIHATHATEHELDLLNRYQCTVCVCPTTEGDLGDGIAPYKELVDARIPLAIGSDSNTRFDPFEELRWAEYSARMRYEQRRILLSNPLASPGPFLLDMGTQWSARSLTLQTGSIAPGMSADLIAIDLNHPSLQGWSPDDLLDTLFFGSSAAAIKQIWVQGNKRLA